jgi:hypothetical protein
MDSDEITGRPDDTSTEAQKAEYEQLKAKWLAELPAEPYWLNEPTVPADDLFDLLDRLVAESEANPGKKSVGPTTRPGDSG